MNIDEINPIPERMEALRERQASIKLRCHAPGIVESYDEEQQTVNVRVAIRECLINEAGKVNWTEIPLLLDVPIVFPRAGGYVLTLPINQGDEVLVCFGDACIDAWWQNGGVQNQVDTRRHDLSDAFAIPGPWSQPRRVSGYSTNSCQLRNEAGTAYVELAGSTINIVGAAVNITAPVVNIDGPSTTITGTTKIDGKTTVTGATDIQGRDFLSHTHSGVETGGGSTGGVN